MPSTEEIKEAEAHVAELQTALTTVQAGLQDMEQVAEAVEQTKDDSQRLARIALAGFGIALVLIVIASLRRRR